LLNPYKPEPKKKEQSRKHEMTPIILKKGLTGQAKTRKKDMLDFVLSKFRVFVMKIFFHKMQRNCTKNSN